MKFIITVTGPAMLYRLELLRKASPDIIKDYVIIFTDEYSLPLYKDYHDVFTFVTMDKIRENYPISLQYEQFLNVPTEEELWAGLLDFYNGEDKKLYPYDIHRFIMPYMAEQNILNFTIIDSDMMFRNDVDMIKSFFESIPSGTIFMPKFGEDGKGARDLREPFIQENVAPSFPQINFNRESLIVADGFVRGFHFKNKEDLMLYFNLWNTSIEKIYTIESNWINSNVILDLNWLSPYLMQFFESTGYEFRDHNDFQYQNKLNTYTHVTRPEDTFYFGERGGWLHHNFDYSNTTNISSFIKNNKTQLKKYYDDFLETIEITDTHYYTKIR
jgi:hypothetical protein